MIMTGEHAPGQVIARFLAEEAAIARLSHPNVIRIYHIGDHDGRPFLEL